MKSSYGVVCVLKYCVQKLLGTKKVKFQCMYYCGDDPSQLLACHAYVMPNCLVMCCNYILCCSVLLPRGRAAACGVVLYCVVLCCSVLLRRGAAAALAARPGDGVLGAGHL